MIYFPFSISLFLVVGSAKKSINNFEEGESAEEAREGSKDIMTKP